MDAEPTVSERHDDAGFRAFLVGLIRPEATDQRAYPRVDLLIVTFTAVAAVVLIALDVFQRWIWHRPIETLNIDGAANIETWVHTVILGGAALAALGIAFTFFDNRNRLYWLVAGFGVAFLSLDKATGLHERFGDRLTHALGLAESSTRIVWIIAWSPIIVAITLAFIAVVRHAPPATKAWIGGGICLAGAKIALEATMFPVLYYGATTYTDNIHAHSGWLYGIEVLIEETVQLFAFAFLFAGFGQLLVDRLLALAKDGAALPVSVIEPAVPLPGDGPATVPDREAPAPIVPDTAPRST